MNEHVLILDNNEQDRKILADLLKGKGYQVSCPSIEDGVIKAIRNADADCVMIEHQVGKENSLALIQQIREDPKINHIPLILVTSAENTDAQLDSLKAGANAYLTKPCDPEEVLVKIDVQLRIRRLQAELEEQLAINKKLVSQLRNDLELGQQVQKSFLPPSQLRTEYFSLNATLIPSGDLSGDYFDYKLITPERLAFFLADVSGHGVASALLASRLKAFFDENFRRAHRPKLFMEQLNRVLIDLGDHYHIATAVVGCVDVVDTVVTYANAGHRNLYWLDIDTKEHVVIPANGPALGMFPEFEMEEGARGFLPGRNRLVLYTDGLVEFKRSDGSWVYEELIRDKILLPKSDEPTETYVESLLNGSRELIGGGTWDDDVSIMVLDF